MAQPDCQTYPDSKIALRQLLYHVQILWQPDQDLSVSSKTLNLTREATNFAYPLHVTVPGPDGREEPAIDFYCESKKVSDWTPEELIAYGHKELLVFLPASCGGATRENVERMISLLEGDYELLLGGFTIAELTFRVNKQYADLEWLEQRRKKMITDPLITRSDLYKDIFEQGREKGREQEQAETQKEKEARLRAEADAAQAKLEAAEAKVQAEKEARLRAEAQAQAAEAEAEVKVQRTIAQTLARARQGVLQIMLDRFLALAGFANNLVATITNPDLLQELFIKLGMARSTEEAEQCLRSVQAALA